MGDSYRILFPNGTTKCIKGPPRSNHIPIGTVMIEAHNGGHICLRVERGFSKKGKRRDQIFCAVDPTKLTKPMRMALLLLDVRL